jgi:hypothetical protein
MDLKSLHGDIFDFENVVVGSVRKADVSVTVLLIS